MKEIKILNCANCIFCHNHGPNGDFGDESDWDHFSCQLNDKYIGKELIGRKPNYLPAMCPMREGAITFSLITV